MNKTLSLIEEEADEEFFTNNDDRSHSNFNETRKLNHQHINGVSEEDLQQINETIERS